MNLLKVLTGDQLLKTIAMLCSDPQQHVIFAKDLFYTMKMSKGVGLAAPQVGVQLRIIAVDTTGSGGKWMGIMINPEITSRSGECSQSEGCLSFPSEIVTTKRSSEITVSYCGFDGAKITRKFSGLDAVCIQHEIDHLDGVTFHQRVSDAE